VCVFGSGWVGRRTLSAEELARDVELLAADNNNLLAVQKLLGDSGGQAAKKMALSIDDNLRESALLRRILHSCILEHCSEDPPFVCPPCRAGARKDNSGSGMRTTGSKVLMLTAVVLLVVP